MATKPSIPKGTRDFLPTQVRKRAFIFDTIEAVFKKYGYQPIETPTMENLSTLTGKYGDEGDKLLFKVLNNGDYLAKADTTALEAKDSAKLTASISKRGMRYDLTVPFARYVVQHQNELSFPFKRYQIQPVWRADRPQKGRYQEFYQCDVDIVGSDSLMYEAELVSIYDEVFAALGLEVVIHINNRKILYGLAEAAGITDHFMPMTIALDKLDKIGPDRVVEEMNKAGISTEAAQIVMDLLQIESLSEIEAAFAQAPTGLAGVAELTTFHQYHDLSTTSNTVKWDITLARGLNYYTGCIFEVKTDTTKYPDLVMGSIGGGGRYDDPTSGFGMKSMSGVGVSFGAERIYDVMQELDLFPQTVMQDLDVLVVAFDPASHLYGYQVALDLRAQGITVDIYPEPTKMKKQMKYANDRQAPYVIVIGTDEMESGLLTFKNMDAGTQEKLALIEIAKRLSSVGRES